MKASTVARVASWLIGLAGMGFVLRLFWTQRDQLADTLRRATPAWLLVGLVVAMLGMGVIAWVWRLLVIRLGSDLPVVQALRGFFVGQLGKYVPGGVWVIVGQGEGARREGVSGPVAYMATGLASVTAYVAAGLVAAATLVTAGSLLGPLDDGVTWLVIGVAAVGPIGLLGLHPAVLGGLVELARRVTKRPLELEVLPWRTSAGLVARQLATWLLVGAATWLTVVALGGDLPFDQVLLATCVSWTAGFLFLPVPGGIGVREAAFVAVLGGTPLAATVALAARLLFVLADLVAAGLATGLAAATRPTQP